jgi:hypothetical protein
LTLYDDGADWWLGYIARPDNFGSTTIDPNNPRFGIVEEVPYPMGGETLHRVGSASGWTYGTVVDTCRDIPGLESDVKMLCQDLIDYGSAGGDSGAPVFFWYEGTGGVDLYGVHWGRRPGTTTRVFSAMNNIEHELGTLRVF